MSSLALRLIRYQVLHNGSPQGLEIVAIEAPPIYLGGMHVFELNIYPQCSGTRQEIMNERWPV